MEECVKLGLAKSIGLSNFNSIQVKQILDVAEVKPVNNQVYIILYCYWRFGKCSEKIFYCIN